MPPLGPVGSVACVGIGLLVAVVAVLVTTHVLAASAAYRAQAQLGITVPETGGNARLTRLIASGQPTKTAGAVIAGAGIAARAAAGVPGPPVITVVATPDLITITVTARSAAVAEQVAQTDVDLAIRAVDPVISPLRLVQVSGPAGTAVAAGWSSGMVTAAIAPPAFMLGLFLALATRWLVGRRSQRSVAKEG